jgi:hypothetical protein
MNPIPAHLTFFVLLFALSNVHTIGILSLKSYSQCVPPCSCKQLEHNNEKSNAGSLRTVETGEIW